MSKLLLLLAVDLKHLAQHHAAPPVFKPQGQPVQLRPAPPVFKPQGQPVQLRPAPPVFKPQAQPLQVRPAPPAFKPQAQPVQLRPAPPAFKPQVQQVQRRPAPPAFKPQVQPLQCRPAQPELIQRKIKVRGKWYSFENLYDDHGNPFLFGPDGRKQFSMVQDMVYLKDVKKGEEFLPIDQDKKVNIYRNFGYGRPMNLRSEEGEKFKSLPFKDYKFKQSTPFDIAVFPESQEKGPLYPDFYKSMSKDLEGGLDKVDKKHNPILKRVDSVKKEMVPVIWGEDYRNPGAKRVFDKKFEESRDTIKTRSEEYSRKRKRDLSPVRKKRRTNTPKQDGKKLQKEFKGEISKEMESITSKLPFAGTGGKKNFAKSLSQGKWDFLDDDDMERVVTSGNWYGIQSPLREDEKYV